jgi:hypothetical protein
VVLPEPGSSTTSTEAPDGRGEGHVVDGDAVAGELLAQAGRLQYGSVHGIVSKRLAVEVSSTPLTRGDPNDTP